MQSKGTATKILDKQSKGMARQSKVKARLSEETLGEAKAWRSIQQKSNAMAKHSTEQH